MVALSLLMIRSVLPDWPYMSFIRSSKLYNSAETLAFLNHCRPPMIHDLHPLLGLPPVAATAAAVDSTGERWARADPLRD